MKKIAMSAAFVIVASALGFAIGQRSQQPAVSINPELAWFSVNGASLKGTSDKRLSLMTLRYNEVTIPCVVMDAKPSSLSRDLFAPSLSCGWTPENIAAISTAK